MSSTAYQNKKLAIVSGTQWSVLDGQGKAASSNPKVSKAALRTKIRKQAALLGASRYCINEVDSSKYLGLWCL
jgi:hypothetical protein